MNPQRGNAFVITLISVILLGALTFVTMRQMGASSVETLSDEKAEIYANQLIAQANQMKSVIDQMLTTGATIDTLSFEKPSSGTFNSGTTILKVYHPAGGGLNVPSIPPSEAYKTGYSADKGWQIQYGTNVDWTPTIASDIIYSTWGITDEICQKINLRLTGSSTIPGPYVANFGQIFQRGSTDGDFTAAICSECNGRAMLCMQKDSGTNAFYSIVAQR